MKLNMLVFYHCHRFMTIDFQEHHRYLLLMKQSVCDATLTSTGSSSHSMNVSVDMIWNIIVNNVFDLDSIEEKMY